MKEKYEELEAEIIRFEDVDVIVTSTPGQGGHETNLPIVY